MKLAINDNRLVFSPGGPAVGQAVDFAAAANIIASQKSTQEYPLIIDLRQVRPTEGQLQQLLSNLLTVRASIAVLYLSSLDKASQNLSDDTILQIKALVDAEGPAFCLYFLSTNFLLASIQTLLTLPLRQLHFDGCKFYDADGSEIDFIQAADIAAMLPEQPNTSLEALTISDLKPDAVALLTYQQRLFPRLLQLNTAFSLVSKEDLDAMIPEAGPLWELVSTADCDLEASKEQRVADAQKIMEDFPGAKLRRLNLDPMYAVDPSNPDIITAPVPRLVLLADESIQAFDAARKLSISQARVKMSFIFMGSFQPKSNFGNFDAGVLGLICQFAFADSSLRFTTEELENHVTEIGLKMEPKKRQETRFELEVRRLSMIDVVESGAFNNKRKRSPTNSICSDQQLSDADTSPFHDSGSDGEGLSLSP